jgi:hypothetical protein
MAIHVSKGIIVLILLLIFHSSILHELLNGLFVMGIFGVMALLPAVLHIGSDTFPASFDILTSADFFTMHLILGLYLEVDIDIDVAAAVLLFVFNWKHINFELKCIN